MTKDNNILICAAIPYLSGDMHVGNAMDGIYADCLARYYRKQGKDVEFTLGTDDHGIKVQRKAEEAGLSPRDYADGEYDKFTDNYKKLSVDYSVFTRTSADKSHQDGVLVAWDKIQKYIYKDVYKGKYDAKEEQFVTLEEARQIKEQDPDRYERLEDTEEENYFFRLSDFNDTLLEKIESDEIRIIPKRAKQEILGLLKGGLQDISFTRPSSKVSWGIPIPNDPDQVMYVWLDALMNYITAVGYPSDKYQDFWPCDVQVIGKDIARFHATIWPAILIALELPVYKTLYVHGHVSMNNKPMSKSLGNVLVPDDVISKYNSDVLRYYLMRHIPSHGDGDFSWDKLRAAYNGELANDLGNVVSRTAAMINKYFEGQIGELAKPDNDITEYHNSIEEMHFDRALDFIFRLLQDINKYIEDQKPWAIAKEGDEDKLRAVLSTVTTNIVQVADLIEPFLPETGAKINKIFAANKIDFDGSPLFPRIEE